MLHKQLSIDYSVFDTIDELALDEQELVRAAHKATSTSYSPYSNFEVGSAVQLQDGSILTGSNQENASYGLAVCAERTALFAAGIQGEKDSVRKIAIVAHMANTPDTQQRTQPVAPCGACRQVIKEYEDLSGQPMIILCAAWNGKIFRFEGIDPLLPLPFGPSDFID